MKIKDNPHPIQQEIHSYMKANKVSAKSLGERLGCHENSIRDFFKRPYKNTFNIIEWYYMKRSNSVPQFKKNLINKEIDSILLSLVHNKPDVLKKIDELKQYIELL